MQSQDKAFRETLSHIALLALRVIGLGSGAADSKLRNLLRQHKSLEGILQACTDYSPIEAAFEIAQVQAAAKRLERIPFSFQVLSVFDPAFPENLQQREDYPAIVYVRGDVGLFRERSMAVVGTRSLNDRIDQEEGERIVRRLVDKKYVIVSGLAAGCDTLAHTSAMKYGGRTIAVLGTPLDKVYPRENKELQERIAAEQAVVSQYPVGCKTYPSHFAYRNNVTVGLASDGVVIIRADDKSGTQHAVRACLAQQKQLYVLENNLKQGYEWTELYARRFKVPNKHEKNNTI